MDKRLSFWQNTVRCHRRGDVWHHTNPEFHRDQSWDIEPIYRWHNCIPHSFNRKQHFERKPQQASHMGRKMDGAVQFRQMCSSANNKKKEPVQIIYILHGHNLEQISSSKYLRVTITSDLKWSAHIQNICQKSNRTIGFLKRVQSHSVIMTTLSLNNVDSKASFWITTSISGFTQNNFHFYKVLFH